MDEEETEDFVQGEFSFFRPENKVLILDKIITPATAAAFVDSLYTCMAQTDQSIVIFFNSPGGDVYSTLMIINAIQSVPNKTVGIVLGCAGSGAFYAFQACEHRFMMKHSMLFWHEMIQVDMSPTTDANVAKKKYNDYIKLNEHILKFFKKRINISKEDYSLIFQKENDILFNSSEALKNNLTDKVINKITDLKSIFKEETDGTK